MKIAIIGAGNVATHIAGAFSGYAEVVQVAARSMESASALASKIDGWKARRRGLGNSSVKVESSEEPGLERCEPVTDLSLLRRDCDLYMIAVNDDSVADVVSSTPDWPGIWVHTSGSVSMDVFNGYKTNYGVFYPLQTFSKEVPVDFSEVPVLLEGSSPEVAGSLAGIAEKITRTVRFADSSTREAIHVAAVFACNFANLMWCEADRLLRGSTDLDIRFLLPLLRATLGKISLKTPREAMTGPARRGDMEVINKHIAVLPPDLKTVYSLLSEKILAMYCT